jgi:apolipoprotein N-acyltransferase
MASEKQPEQQATHLRAEVQRIIAAGQTPQKLRTGSVFSAAVLTAVSLTLLWLSFTPAEFAPLAWIALVPLCQLLRLRTLPKFCLSLVWMVSFVWALATLQWMRLGHPAMFLALAALAASRSQAASAARPSALSPCSARSSSAKSR